MGESLPAPTAEDLKAQLHEQVKREANERIMAIIAGTALRAAGDAGGQS